MFKSSLCVRVFEVAICIRLPVKFGKVTSLLAQLNPRSPLDDGVKVLFLLALCHHGDVSGQQRVRDVPDRDIVAYPEALMDTVLLLVSELVEHAAHVRHLVVVRNLGGHGLTTSAIWSKVVISLKVIFFFLNAMDPWRVPNVVGRVLPFRHFK